VHTQNVTHSYVWRDSSLVPCPTSGNGVIYKCDVTHAYAERDSFIRVTWLIRGSHVVQVEAKGSFISGMWLIHTQNVTRSYVWRDSSVGPMSHRWGQRGHSYVWRDSFIRMMWLVYKCDVTHSYVWHDSFTSVTWLIHTCDVTHSYVWRDSCLHHMPHRWRQRSQL